MKLHNIFLALLLVWGLLLINSFLFVIFLRLNSNALINNKTYQREHQQISNFLLTGNEQSLKKALSSNEMSHIEDVRLILLKIPVTIFLLLSAALYLARHYQKVVVNDIFKYSITSIIIISVLLVVLFMPLFLFFHNILFPQGNWAFSESSILIQLYPEQFWRNSSLIILILTLLELIIAKIIFNRTTLNSVN